MSGRRWVVLAFAALALAALGVTAAFAGDGHGRDKSKSSSTQTTTSSRSSKNEGDEDKSSKSNTNDKPNTSDSQKLCGLDIVWLKTSAEGDLFEIQGGKLALKKSSNQAVITLAQTLISDHTQSLHETQQVASKLGVDLPSEPSPSQQWELEELGEMSGATFNHDYSELEVLDHEQDIEETQDEINLSCNPTVRDLAKSDIPMLQKHLQLAKQALQSSGPEPHNSTSQTQNGSDENGG